MKTDNIKEHIFVNMCLVTVTMQWKNSIILANNPSTEKRKIMEFNLFSDITTFLLSFIN